MVHIKIHRSTIWIKPSNGGGSDGRDDDPGVWPVLCTPFTRDGAVDPRAMRRIVRFAMDSRVSGVVFPGFASEVDDLTPVERVELLRVVLDELGGTLPIIAGASSPTLAEAIARVQEVQHLGIGR